MLACMVVLKCRVCDATAGYLRCSIKTVDLYNLAFVWWRKNETLLLFPIGCATHVLLPLLCFWRTPSQSECAMHPIECCNAWFAPLKLVALLIIKEMPFFCLSFFFIKKDWSKRLWLWRRQHSIRQLLRLNVTTLVDLTIDSEPNSSC